METQAKGTIRVNCFGFHRKPMDENDHDGVPECSVLECLKCAKGKCSFYKNRTVWMKELQELHGTMNIDLIIRQYEERKAKQEAVSKKLSLKY
jgi:hypothetical protein